MSTKMNNKRSTSMGIPALDTKRRPNKIHGLKLNMSINETSLEVLDKTQTDL